MDILPLERLDAAKSLKYLHCAGDVSKIKDICQSINQNMIIAADATMTQLQLFATALALPLSQRFDSWMTTNWTAKRYMFHHSK